MSALPKQRAARTRQSIPLLHAGCATGAVSVVLRAILAITANAIYWINAQGTGPMQRSNRANIMPGISASG
jgi:hypothetical protein